MGEECSVGLSARHPRRNGNQLASDRCGARFGEVRGRRQWRGPGEVVRAPPGPAKCRTADPGRVRGPGSDPGWAHVQPSTSAWLSINAAAPFSPCSRVKSWAGTSSSSRKGSPASRSAVRYPSTRKWLGSTGPCRPPLVRRRRAGVLDEDRVAPALCRQERRLDKHGEVPVDDVRDDEGQGLRPPLPQVAPRGGGPVVQLLDRVEDPLARVWPDVGPVVHDVGDRLPRHPRQRGDVLDRDDVTSRRRRADPAHVMTAVRGPAGVRMPRGASARGIPAPRRLFSQRAQGWPRRLFELGRPAHTCSRAGRPVGAAGAEQGYVGVPPSNVWPGMDAMSWRVYSSRGLSKISSGAPLSTTRPERMT
jgi:hypothetical protein